MENNLEDIPFYSEWMSPSPTVVLHTSGSTGKPSTFVAEKKRMEASARRTCAFLNLKEGDTALLCMSTDFVGGKMMIVRALTCRLRLTCIEPCGHPMADMGDTPFDLAAMVPMQVYNSLEVPEERRRLMRIRHLIIGGGPIDPALAEKLKDMPNAIWSTYGMTETLSHVALRRLNGNAADEWYTPFEGVDISVDGDGRIVVSAPDICATPLTTNDLGEMHPDGRRFRILGRFDNTVCCGGMKFHIEEIEGILAGKLPVPFIITKRKDEKFGEIVVLLHTEGEEEALRRACNSLMPKYMRPKAYIRVGTLPYTLSGKPARAQALTLASEQSVS